MKRHFANPMLALGFKILGRAFETLIQMQQIKSREEMEGKTIKRTAYTDNNLFFFFTDNTFAIAKGCGWDERDVEITDDEFNLEPNDYNIDDLKEIGILDFEQWQKLKSEKENRQREFDIKRELEKLAELKRKYEK